LVPLSVAVAGSSLRLYRLTGYYGLIAAYEPMQRVFGETDVGRLDVSWIANGAPHGFYFAPRTKEPIRPEHVEHMRGFIADPVLLAQIRARRLRGVPMTRRVARMIDNVELLALRNLPWPEDDFIARDRRRFRLQQFFGRATLVMIPLAVYGLFCLRRHFVGKLLVWAHLITPIYVAAFYLGEARYRVPYDTFAIVAATAALFTIGRSVALTFARSIRMR
jgi:hypothetical protein